MTLRERAHIYSLRNDLRYTHDVKGPWFAGCTSGSFDGWLAGYRAGKRDGKAEAMKAAGWEP